MKIIVLCQEINSECWIETVKVAEDTAGSTCTGKWQNKCHDVMRQGTQDIMRSYGIRMCGRHTCTFLQVPVNTSLVDSTINFLCESFSVS